MFADLWKDFLSRFWWSILAVLILIGGVIWWYISSQTVMISGYRVSKADAAAVEYYKQNDLPKAEEAYKAIVKDHPRDWFAWNGLANVYRDENLLQSAEEAYLKALAINPKFEQVYRNIFGLYYAWANTDATQLAKAEPILLQGLKLMPKSQNIVENLVNYYAKTGDQQKLQQYRSMLDALRNPQPKLKSNSLLTPRVYEGN